MASSASIDDIFVNCPFDSRYAPIFQALVFAIYACGFRPRCTKELDDDGQARIEKLFNLIKSCRYGVHDLSRTQLDKSSRLPRFNMPFELGLFLGAKRFGGPTHAQKRLLIFDTKQYRYQKFISDLAGMDIHAHRNKQEVAVSETRDWLANVSRRTLLSKREIVRAYKEFKHDYPKLIRDLGLPKADVAYVDYERIVVGWLTK